LTQFPQILQHFFFSNRSLSGWKNCDWWNTVVLVNNKRIMWKGRSRDSVFHIEERADVMISNQRSFISVEPLILFDEIKMLNKRSFFNDFQQLIGVYWIVTFFNVQSKVRKFGATLTSPLLYKSIKLLFDLSIIKNWKAQLVPQVIFHVSKYKLSIGEYFLEGLLDRRILFYFHLFVEGDDRPKRAFFR